ncbi:TetR family transcriptional regulator C-terminal domain-containing protein [Thiolapillus sp.]
MFHRSGGADSNLEQTRQRLLEAAFNEIYKYGFQAASLSRILRHTGVTKGALYHHFSSKTELGYAVVEEIIATSIEEFWVKPLHQSGNPIDTFIEQMYKVVEETGEEMLRLGCPLNNLAQEMSPIDDGFRERLEQIYISWREAIATALTVAQERGQVRRDIDPGQTSIFVLAALEGCVGSAKAAQSMDMLYACGNGLIHYLNGLRVEQENRS